MSRLKTFVLSTLAMTSFATVTLAADMSLPAAPMQAQPYAPQNQIVELGGGWYLRGDVGYVNYQKPTGNGIGTTNIAFDNEKLNKTFSVGGGVGYKFNSWFRADATLDYNIKSNFKATSSSSGYVDGYSLESAKIDSAQLMLNGYIDLGEFYGITPYVGAGVGVAQNRMENFRGPSYLYPSSPLFPVGAISPYPYSTTLPANATSYNLAWALMAGAAINLSQNFMLDVGYRYINMGDAKTKYDQFGVGAKVKDLDAHEARLGVRYMID